MIGSSLRPHSLASAVVIAALWVSSALFAEPTTAPAELEASIDSALVTLDNSTTQPKEIENTFANALAALAALRQQAQLTKTAPTDSAKRSVACRFDLIEAELNRRAGASLPESDPTRATRLQRAAALYRSLRIAYRELPFAAAGYAGEARVLRNMGMLPRADRVLDSVILELKDRKFDKLPPNQMQLQRVFWFERLEHTQARDSTSAGHLVQQITSSAMMRDASESEKQLLQRSSSRPNAASAPTGPNSFDPILELAKSLVRLEPVAGVAQAANTGMSDLVKEIRSRGLDVCFVLDATESMGPYIEQSKARFGEIVSVVTRMVGIDPATTGAARVSPIRFGLVAFKDYGDDYGIEATKQLPLTGDTKKLQSALDEVIAGGGGDVPEPIDQALRVATANKMGWNRRRHNVIVLVTDAPVHGTGREAAYSLASTFAKNLDGELNIIDVGGFVNGKRIRSTVLPDLNRIAENGRGSAFLLADDQAFWRHLIVSMFGERYEQDVQGILDEYATQQK